MSDSITGSQRWYHNELLIFYKHINHINTLFCWSCCLVAFVPTAVVPSVTSVIVFHPCSLLYTIRTLQAKAPFLVFQCTALAVSNKPQEDVKAQFGTQPIWQMKLRAQTQPTDCSAFRALLCSCVIFLSYSDFFLFVCLSHPRQSFCSVSIKGTLRVYNDTPYFIFLLYFCSDE